MLILWNSQSTAMSSVNKDGFIFSFPICTVPFLPSSLSLFFGLRPQPGTPAQCGKGVVVTGLVLSWGKLSFLTTKYVVNQVFHRCSSCSWKGFSKFLVSWGVCFPNHEWVLNVANASPAAIEMSLISPLVCGCDHICWFSEVVGPSREINPTWRWGSTLFIRCWIQFANILWIFANVFIGDVSLWFSCNVCVVLVIRGMLAS